MDSCNWRKAYNQLAKKAEASVDEETGMVPFDRALKLLEPFTPEQRNMMLAGIIAAFINGEPV